MKGKGQKQDWAGASRREYIICPPSGSSEHRVPLTETQALSWVEMASTEYQHLAQSFTGGCPKKTASINHWLTLHQEHCEVGCKAEADPEDNHS